jgi:hypothetical protein
MRGFLAAVALTLVLLGLIGCADWQANKSSQAVDINPCAIGSTEPVITPSNDNRYLNGEALDMRSRR